MIRRGMVAALQFQQENTESTKKQEANNQKQTNLAFPINGIHVRSHFKEPHNTLDPQLLRGVMEDISAFFWQWLGENPAPMLLPDFCQCFGVVAFGSGQGFDVNGGGQSDGGW